MGERRRQFFDLHVEVSSIYQCMILYDYYTHAVYFTYGKVTITLLHVKEISGT